jgi:hypothetical protein
MAMVLTNRDFFKEDIQKLRKTNCEAGAAIEPANRPGAPPDARRFLDPQKRDHYINRIRGEYLYISRFFSRLYGVS